MKSSASNTINIVGMDPSLSSWGFAFAKYYQNTGKLKFVKIDVQATSKTKVKNSRVNTDDLSRSKLLSDAVAEAVRHAHVVFVEVPHGSKSARAMASYGICVGILASLRTYQCPFIELSALDVKMNSIGKKTATKVEMISFIEQAMPETKKHWPTKTRKGKTSIIMDQAEHMADAMATIIAGIQTEEFKQLSALNRQL